MVANKVRFTPESGLLANKPGNPAVSFFTRIHREWQLIGGGHPRPGGDGGDMQAPGGRPQHIVGSSTAAAEITPRASYTLPAPTT